MDLLLAPLLSLLSALPLRQERYAYEFSGNEDLDDFEVVEGRWSVSGGALSCSSKGTDDRMRWRRELTDHCTVETALSGGGRVALVLLGADATLTFSFQRAKGSWSVSLDDRLLKEAFLETPQRDALPVLLALAPDRLRVTVGDEDVQTLSFGREVAGLRTLELCSDRAQARFLRLVVERRAGGTGPGVDPAGEQRRLALEDAARLLEEGHPRDALETLLALVPPSTPAASLPPDLTTLLQRVLLEDARLASHARMQGWMDERRLRAGDGSVSLVLPLRPEWSGEAPRVRRVDGELLRVACASPRLALSLYRYDQKLQYWFGEEPRLHYVQGSSMAAIARARFEDLLVERPHAQAIEEPDRLRLRLDGEAVVGLRIAFGSTQPDDPLRRELVQYYVLHRGNTLCLSIEAAPRDLAAADLELRWILQTLELHDS